jgi:ribosomal protein L22
MSELSVSERRIKLIHDAIEGENWKQALQICEKWQKKGEKSDHFQVKTLSTCCPKLSTETSPRLSKLSS